MGLLLLAGIFLVGIDASNANAQLTAAVVPDYRDMLYYPPHYLFCDCTLPPSLNPDVLAHLNAFSARYNQRMCDLYQWYLLVDINMPGLPLQYHMKMVRYIGRYVMRFMQNAGLPFMPPYGPYCGEMRITDVPALAKRNVISSVTSSASSASSSFTESTSSSSSSTYSGNAAALTGGLYPNGGGGGGDRGVPSYYSMSQTTRSYYNNMNYLLSRIMPNVPLLLQRQIESVIYTNAPLNYFANARNLIFQLNLNVRHMLGSMLYKCSVCQFSTERFEEMIEHAKSRKCRSIDPRCLLHDHARESKR